MNPAQSHGDAQVTVNRWLATYFVPGDHPAPQDLRLRLDNSVSARLAENCGLCLEQFLEAADPAVWRIRKLAVNLSLGAGSSDLNDFARDCGQRLAEGIGALVDQGEQSDSVLRFPGRAAFVAQFVFDLAGGRAWGKWFYEEFESLRAMSESEAIRRVILGQDLLQVEVILQLASAGRLETVLCALNEGDARAIYEACFENSLDSLQNGGIEKWTGAVLELWNESPLRSASHDENRFRDALRLFGRAVSRFPDARNDTGLRLAIDGLLELRCVFSGIRSPLLTDSLIKNLARGDFQIAVQLAHGAGMRDQNGALDFFARSMNGDEHWGAQALAVILSGHHQEKFLTSRTISHGESLLSSFGGIFLLGPSFQAVRLDELIEAAVGPCESSENVAAILRHLAVLKSLGRMRIADAADDPAIRLFSGFDGPLFRRPLENLDARSLNLDAAHKMLLQTLVDPEARHWLCIFGELLPLPTGDVSFILRDLAHDTWLAAVPVGATGSQLTDVVRASLARLSDICGRRPETLFLSEPLASVLSISGLDNTADRVTVLSQKDTALQGILAEQLKLSPRRLAVTLNSAQRDYSYFCLSHLWSDFEIDPALDCAFSLIASVAMKNFARRLPGFEDSSPNHLYQNFLAGLCAVRCIDSHLEVRLPASPLSLILRMAGLQEQKYAPAWLEGREVWLLPPQE